MIIKKSKKNKTMHNTDNKGKLTCHGFCKDVPAAKTTQE